MRNSIDYFYYGTIKKIIATFGLLFSNVVYSNDFNEMIKVPIHYSPKEKFLEFRDEGGNYDSTLETDYTLPRFGFELLSIDYDGERAGNSLSKMREVTDKNEKYMLNRVPYNFNFVLYLATRKFEDSLKIVEQIIPFFTPSLNVTIQDKTDFGITTDIPFILNNINYTIDYQGSFENRRTINWELNFLAKAFLYSNMREQKRIKETIIKLDDQDFNLVYETLTSKVIPQTANKTDIHTIIDNIVFGPPPIEFSFNITTGEHILIEPDTQENQYSLILLHPIEVGSKVEITECFK